MALPTSGPLSLNDIAGEFGGSTPHSLSEYYGAAAGIPTSGTIRISDFYGAASLSPATLLFAPVQSSYPTRVYSVDITNPASPSLLSTAVTPFNLQYNSSIDSAVLSTKRNRLFACDNTNQRITVWDVSNPSAISYFAIAAPLTRPFYLALDDDADVLYVASSDNSTTANITSIDVSNLTGGYFSSVLGTLDLRTPVGGTYTGLNSLAIDTANKRLYTTMYQGGSAGNGCMIAANISNPASMSYMSHTNAVNFPRGIALDIGRGLAFTNWQYDGISIANISNPSSISLAGSISGQYSNYNQGYSANIDPNRNVLFTNWGGRPSVVATNVSNASSPSYISHATTSGSSGGRQDRIDITNNYYYNAVSNLAVWNVSNTSSMTRSAFFSFASGGIYAVALAQPGPASTSGYS